MPEVYLRETNNVRTQFEAAIQHVGQNGAKRAFARAINHETRKASTQIRRQVAKASSIKYGDVTRATRFKGANPNQLAAKIIAKGQAFPLKYFGAKQFSYGVRAKVWGQTQRYKSAFIVGRYANDAFVRKGKARFPISKMWGPSVPAEIMRPPILDTFARNTDAIGTRAAHEVKAIIEGHARG